MIRDTVLLKWPTLLSVQQHFSDCLQFYCKLRLQLQLCVGIFFSMIEMQGKSVSAMAEDTKGYRFLFQYKADCHIFHKVSLDG